MEAREAKVDQHVSTYLWLQCLQPAANRKLAKKQKLTAAKAHLVSIRKARNWANQTGKKKKPVFSQLLNCPRPSPESSE